MPRPASTALTWASIQALRLSPLCLSLKRMLKRAVAVAGMTLVARLPVSILVISQVRGLEMRAAAVERFHFQKVQHVDQRRDRVPRLIGVSGMPLHAKYLEQAIQRTAPAILIVSPAAASDVHSPRRQASGFSPLAASQSTTLRVPLMAGPSSSAVI